MFRKKLSRPQFQRFMAQHPQCLVAIEDYSGAHQWARESRSILFRTCEQFAKQRTPNVRSKRHPVEIVA